MNIKRTVSNIFYGYDPQYFMPVYLDGKLSNRHEFIRYKWARAKWHIARAYWTYRYRLALAELPPRNNLGRYC